MEVNLLERRHFMPRKSSRRGSTTAENGHAAPIRTPRRVVHRIIAYALVAAGITGCSGAVDSHQGNGTSPSPSGTTGSPAAVPTGTQSQTTARRTVLLRHAVKKALGARVVFLGAAWVTPDGGIVTSWSVTEPGHVGRTGCSQADGGITSALAGQRGKGPVWVIPFQGDRDPWLLGDSIWVGPAYESCVGDRSVPPEDPSQWLVSGSGKRSIAMPVAHPVPLTKKTVAIPCRTSPCVLDPTTGTYGPADIAVPKGYQLVLGNAGVGDLLMATKSLSSVALSADSGRTWHKHDNRGNGVLLATRSISAFGNGAGQLEVTTDGGATWRMHQTKVMDEGHWVVTRSGRLFYSGFSEAKEAVCGRSVDEWWTRFEPLTAPHGCADLSSAGDLVYTTRLGEKGTRILSISRDHGDSWEEVTLR